MTNEKELQKLNKEDLVQKVLDLELALEDAANQSEELDKAKASLQQLETELKAATQELEGTKQALANALSSVAQVAKANGKPALIVEHEGKAYRMRSKAVYDAANGVTYTLADLQANPEKVAALLADDKQKILLPA